MRQTRHTGDVRPRRFLELQCQKVRRTDDRSGDRQFIFLRAEWHKTPFNDACPFCRSCSTPAASSPSSVKSNNTGRWTYGRDVTATSWGTELPPKPGNSVLWGTVNGVTHQEHHKDNQLLRFMTLASYIHTHARTYTYTNTHTYIHT